MPKDGRIARQRQAPDKAPAKRRGHKRMYEAAKVGRLDFRASTSSEDAELYTSLSQVRAKSRALIRDNVYARRARSVVVNNVIGQGVGIQGQVKQARGNKLHRAINSAIEKVWRAWSRAPNCHTGAALHFAELERLLVKEIFSAGEVFLRLYVDGSDGSPVPLKLEVIEAERLADDYEIQATAPGARVTMGVEHDSFYRPIAYHIKDQHPGDLRRTSPADTVRRIPADQIMHLRIIDRWPQTRAIPLMHAAVSRLNQLGEYENAALVAARIGASKVGFFEPSEWVTDDVTEETDDEETGTEPPTLSTRVEAGEFMQLPAGYKFSGWDPKYPTEAFDPFTRAFLRGAAAALDLSYETLSRDYSQSNYSSSRLSQLDDRDAWRVLQSWWARSFRDPLHAYWMNLAVLSGALPEVGVSAYAADRERFLAVRYKFRGWQWVDPQKEVNAYKEAERAGYLTKADIIAATNGGADLEDVIDGRRHELDMLAEAGLATDTTNEAEAGELPADDQAPAGADDETDDETETEGRKLTAVGGKA